jgi:hypothetical protein
MTYEEFYARYNILCFAKEVDGSDLKTTSSKVIQRLISDKVCTILDLED